MQLVFKNKSDTSNFSAWLKAFNEIQSSLLIECDLVQQAFISKGFTTDHTVVKYSKISFDNAGLELESIKDNTKTYTLDEWNKRYKDTRIKIGIFMILPKFIKVIETFSDTNFKLLVEFDVYNNANTQEFHAIDLKFKSKTCNMKVKDCNISEFEQVSDDLFFNKINIIDQPMSFEISLETLKNLLSISSVFLTDAKRDIIKFYTKKCEDTDKWAIFAYDETNESYDYLLGYLIDGEGTENSVPLYRQGFFTAVNVKGSDENIIITLSSVSKQKLRIQTVDNTSYTVLSTIQ